jgi:hypothetical protein
MVCAPQPDLHIGAVRRVHRTFIFEFPVGTQIRSRVETTGQQHGDRKDPCWRDRNYINLTCHNTNNSIKLEKWTLMAAGALIKRETRVYRQKNGKG